MDTRAAGRRRTPATAPRSAPLDADLPHDPVQRAASRVQRSGSGPGVVWERLTTESIRNVDFLHVTYEVGGESSPADAFQRHSGQEWGYVLSGTLTVRIGFDEFLLQPGDAISFDSATPHRLFNAGDVPATAVWFVARPAHRRTSPGAEPRRRRPARADRALINDSNSCCNAA